MNVYLPGREMPQSWPGSSGGLAPKRGPGNFDRERPHCLLRSSATMDVASNWEQNSALEMFSEGGGGVAACSSALFVIIFIYSFIDLRPPIDLAALLYLFTLLFIYLVIDTAAPLRFIAAASPGRAASSPKLPTLPNGSPSLPGSEFVCNLLCHCI